jgi:hypothetical protein
MDGLGELHRPLASFLPEHTAASSYLHRREKLTPTALAMKRPRATYNGPSPRRSESVQNPTPF